MFRQLKRVRLAPAEVNKAAKCQPARVKTPQKRSVVKKENIFLLCCSQLRYTLADKIHESLAGGRCRVIVGARRGVEMTWKFVCYFGVQIICNWVSFGWFHEQKFPSWVHGGRQHQRHSPVRVYVRQLCQWRWACCVATGGCDTRPCALYNRDKYCQCAK